MRIVIASTGAGGHLFCGLSIAEEFSSKIIGSKVFFLGSNSKLAEKIVRAKGFKFYRIFAAGLTGRGIGSIIKFLCGQLAGIIQSGLVLLYIRPKLVISAGGFVSVGSVLWSRIFGIRCVVHEQNIIPGKANRLAGFLADKVLTSFDDAKHFFNKKKCVFTGMPVRFKERLPKDEARQKLSLRRDLFTVLILGGSSGAHKINKIIADSLAKMPHDTQFIHLTGPRDLTFVKEAYKKFGFNAYVDSFSAEMDIIYSAADLAICRAGSGTLSEISFFGVPAVLIPYPFSRDRHQYMNAEFMAKKGAAFVLPEEDISDDKIINLINNKEKFREMAKKSEMVFPRGAVEKIYFEIRELI